MDKAYTYADFITESMNYQHSQEYYGFMKEMAEIELMESYLTTQQFLLEEATEYSFTEGYLVETGDAEPVKTKLGEKVKNILKKIWEGLKKAWSVFINFMKSIPGKVKGLFDKMTKAKAVVNLLFVAKTANDDPKGFGRIFNKFGDFIEVPSFYSGWDILVIDDTPRLRDGGKDGGLVSSNLNVGFNLKQFARVSSILAGLLNGEKTHPVSVDVCFKFSSDRYSYFDEKASKPGFIQYSAIYNAASTMIDEMSKLGTGDHDLKSLYSVITDDFTDTTSDATEVWVNIGGTWGSKDDVVALDQEFNKAIDSVGDKLEDGSIQIDSEELKYFNEINRALTWAFSEYMIATNHAMKLIADIAKFSGKVKAEYEADQNNTAENDAE
jgi:hypothetical protein